MAKKSQTKGRRAERALEQYLIEQGYLGVRVGTPVSFGSEPDLLGLPYIHVECKHVEKLNIMDAMEQAIRDAEKFNDGLPAVFHKRNYKPWLVTMTMDDWLELYECFVSLHED